MGRQSNQIINGTWKKAQKMQNIHTQYNTKFIYIYIFRVQVSKSIICTSNEDMSYLSTIRNVALLTHLSNKKMFNNYIQQHSQSLHQSINQSITVEHNRCLKLAHAWKCDHLRRESDSYNSKEVNFTCKDKENNQRMKWWENCIERTKTRRALRFPTGVRGHRQLSSALSPTVTIRTSKNQNRFSGNTIAAKLYNHPTSLKAT
jgi:hypothetical protein